MLYVESCGYKKMNGTDIYLNTLSSLKRYCGVHKVLQTCSVFVEVDCDLVDDSSEDGLN